MTGLDCLKQEMSRRGCTKIGGIIGDNESGVQDMNDYIKKSVLLEAVAELQPDASEYDDTEVETQEDFDKSTYWTARDMFDDVMTAIEGATPADVAPVAHGHWIINSDGYYPQCSNCMREPESGKMTKFCPNCGAIMDESEDNNNE